MAESEKEKAKKELQRLSGGESNPLSWSRLDGLQKKDRIVNLLAHIMLVTGIPFLPIFLAFVQGFSVDNQSVLLTISIFILTVALAADELMFFIFGVLAAVVFMVFYGQTVAHAQALSLVQEAVDLHLEAALQALNTGDVTKAIEEFGKAEKVGSETSEISQLDGIVFYAWIVALFMAVSNLINGIRDHIYDDLPVLRVMRRV